MFHSLKSLVNSCYIFNVHCFLNPHPSEKALKFKHIGEICKAYEKCYVLGVHQAIISDIPLEKSCVDAAMLLLEKPRLDLHVKKVGFLVLPYNFKKCSNYS